MSAAAELTVKDVTDDADLEREFTDITIRSTSSSEGAVGDENALLVGGGDMHDLWQQQQSKTSKTNGKSLIAHKHKTPLLCSNKVHDHPRSTVRPFVDKPELNKNNYTTCAFAFSTLVGDSGEGNNTAAENNNNGNEDPPDSDVGSRQDKKDNTSITLSEEGGGGNQDKLKKAWQTPETSSIVMTAVRYGVCLLAGFVFGMAIQKGAVYEPRVIRGQFIYEKFIMLKMFLSALAVGSLSLALLSVLAKTSFDRAYTTYVGCLMKKGVVGTLIGGFLLGAGMTVSGACPGMVLVQVGAWVGNGKALMTLFGCLIGALAYALCDPYLAKLLEPKKPFEKQCIIQWIPIPFCVLAVCLAVVAGTIVFALEWFFPWREELYVPNGPADWFYLLLAWPPAVAGVLIGLLQLALVFAVGDTVGGSSAYCTVTSQILVTKSMEAKVPYLAPFKRGLANWWQVFYVGGAIFGGFMSAFASGSLGSVPGVSLQSAFIGGFLMLFGARMAGGCTSGHGISGVSLLMALSMLAAGAMFAGGTIVGFICLALDKAGLIDYYTF